MPSGIHLDVSGDGRDDDQRRRPDRHVAWGTGASHTALDFTRSTNGGESFETPRRILGEARIPSIPQGKILVQVIAKGYQTFGHTFDISEDEKTLEVTLNPPQQQYSAHE